MSTTITALFDSRADAEAAKDRLRTARVDANDVHIHDHSSSGYSESGYSTHQDRGFWDSVKNAFLPDEDRHAYEEGVRRGGAVLTADVDDDCIDKAVRVLDSANSVDIDERSSQWRSSGWDYPAVGSDAAGTGATLGGYSAADMDLDSDRYARTGDTEEVIPVVEEQLVVGKREVSRGGVRVRSYVTEVPVHEQVRLRNERVDVQRRTVDQPLSTADADAFRERTIDVTATGEEAVVGKNARVVEEVVVSKTAKENVEEIDDTVRRTEVDIDRDSDIERSASTRGTTDRRI
jgi:uncharacterized protein (TIGR02271 family)